MSEIKEIIHIETFAEDKDKRLDIFLNENMEGVTRSYIQNLINNGNIFIEEKAATKCGIKIKGKEKITINIPCDEKLDLLPENIPLEKVYEDKDIVIINKNAGVVVHPAYGNHNGTLVNGLLYHIKDLSGINGIVRPGIVHRLDKDTSGLIIVAKNDTAHVALSGMFKNKTVKKTYLAITKGIFKEKSQKIETLIGRDHKNRKRMAVVNENGKKAITNYTIIDEKNNHSLVMVNIETGRTHQIRVHMKYLNHPIVGDSLYGNDDNKFKRQMLHSYRLEFLYPLTGKKMDVHGNLPEDFLKCLKYYELSIEK
ncbi:MAG: RluA family pseudouridine synthase [Fusobacteriaceae bacterium]|jgi:23S rRNA pseudouridine1911/1915/1917 synthase|nr:RluA family pseudouridine synthase [Fusobacteriaceae bacterium]